jgi:2-keto-3-deoxy-L-rhamnonate aldolase RhmA
MRSRLQFRCAKTISRTPISPVPHNESTLRAPVEQARIVRRSAAPKKGSKMSEQAAPPHTGLRQTLHAPGPVFNAILSIPDPGVAGILGWGGFEYVVADLEHGPFTLSSARVCLDVLAATPTKVVVRPAANDPTYIKQALDLGADGVQVPTVRSAAEAEAAVRAARYSPEGERGVGMGHATRYGSNTAGYLAEANAKVAVLAMIEDELGVRNAAEIAAVEGLDGIVIGPMDLSASLGVLGDVEHEKVQTAIKTVVDAAVAAGTKVGTGCPPERITELGRKGMTLFTCYFDGVALGDGAREAIAAATSAWDAR